MVTHEINENYFEFHDDVPEEKRRYLTVVIYDIINNKRRNRMAKFLQGFGVRVQKSAFECILDKAAYNKLVEGASKIVVEDDLLRIYKLAGNADVQTWGSIGKTEYDDYVIV